jgi:hypothetical protein
MRPPHCGQVKLMIAEMKLASVCPGILSMILIVVLHVAVSFFLETTFDCQGREVQPESAYVG